MKNIKRCLCLLLALVLLLDCVPGALQAKASQTDGICEKHHAVHDVHICGYADGAQEVPCNHAASCDESCKQPIINCVFSHSDCSCRDAVLPVECNHAPEAGCDYAEQIVAITCECQPDADGMVVHAEQCDLEARKLAVVCNRYVPGVEAQSCGHICTGDSGCVVLVCSHTLHDDVCGYKPAVQAQPCKFAGAPCQQCEQEKTPNPVESDGTAQLFAHNAYFDAAIPNKHYFELFFGTDSSDMSKNQKVTNSVAVNQAHQANVCNFGYNEKDGFWSMEFLRPNHSTEIIYTVASGETYSTSLVYTLPEDLKCMLFNDPGCIIGDTWYVPEGNSYDDVKFLLGTDMYVDTTAHLTSGLSFENSDGAIEITTGVSGIYSIKALKQGASAKVVYQFGGKTYELPIVVIQPDLPCLRYWLDENDFSRSGPWQISPGFTDDIKFYIGTNSETMLDTADQRYSVNVSLENNNGIIELIPKDQTSGWYTIKALKSGEATVTCIKDGEKYTLKIIVEEPRFRMIPVMPTGNANYLDLTNLEEGKPMKLRCMLQKLNGGPPVSGALTGLKSSDNRIFTLALSTDPTEASAGIYILTPVSSGKAQILCKYNGKEYSCEAGVLDKTFQADGLLYYPAVQMMSGKTYPCTVMDIPVGGEIVQEFFYSQAAEAVLMSSGDLELTPLTRDQVTCSGPIEVTQPNGDTRLHIKGMESGTGYLEVTSTDGVVHCFVVNVGKGRPNTEVQTGGYMWLNEDTVIGFGNPGIASNGDNNAEPGVLKLRAQVNSGFGSMNYPDEFIYREPVAFAAMDMTDGQPDADIMAKVKNVEFSILACQNTDGTSGCYASVEKNQCEQVALTEGEVKAWTNYIVAGGTEAFKGMVGMTFELPDKKDNKDTTRRISLYILMHNTYMGEEVRVEANVTSAKQLNVILSSYEALKTWIKQEYPEYTDAVDYACNIDVKLPHADLTDAIVVSETIAPFPFRENPSSNPNFRIYLIGPRLGERATMAGLISRGCLAGVFDVNFVADSDVTMNLGEEEFTCGLMADSTWSGAVEYDMDFAAKYGIDPTENKRNLSSWSGDGGMQHADCDIMSVDGCSFEGFDYGTRSTPNGYVGGGLGNAFKNCYFGIYIDCAGKPGWGDIHYTGFSGYDFKKNVAAIRIVGLQENITPYEFRIHDCDFINNYLEFWINDYDTSYLQKYYFYRNHYRGGWKLSGGNSSGGDSSGYGWVKHVGKAPNNEDLPDVHRGPRYQVQDGDTIINNGVSVTISGTPGKAVPNLAVNSRAAGEGYWIYDGDNQMTLIELGGDTLPLAQESLEALTENADVTIVKNKGADTAAIWTFEGGE